MSYGRSLAKIGNSRSLFEHENRVKNKTQKYKINFTIFVFVFWGEIFSLNFAIHKEMKTKQICTWSDFWKHGWILLKLGIQFIIE
jgi:hypothetical protein